MNYLIVESKKSYSVVLDEQGRFLRVANMGYEIGDSLDEVVLMKDHNNGLQAPSRRIMGIVGAVAACLVIVATLFSTVLQPKVDFATLHININPAVSINVSEDGTVTGLTAQNKDGETLIEKYQWKYKAMNKVANELVDRAIELGFLLDDGLVNIEIDAPTDEWFSKCSNTLQKSMKTHLSERIVVTIEIGNCKMRTTQETPADNDATTTQGNAMTTTKPHNPDQTKAPAGTTTRAKHHGNTPTEPVTEKKRLSGNEALQIALQIALQYDGLSHGDVTVDKMEYKEYDGVRYWKIKFESKTKEYQFEIDAYSGKVLDADIDDHN